MITVTENLGSDQNMIIKEVIMGSKFEEAYEVTTGIGAGLLTLVGGLIYAAFVLILGLAALAAAIGGIVWLFS